MPLRFLSLFHSHDILFWLARLSLDLFTHSALAEWSQGNTHRMMKSIDEVFNNANCFEDKLRVAEIKLDCEGMSGTSAFEAIAFGFDGKGLFSFCCHYP